MPRVLKWLLAAIAALIGLLLLAWAATPPWLKSQLESRGSLLLGRELRVERVEFVPWTLSLTLHGLRMDGAAGDAAPGPQFALSRLRLDADWHSLLQLAPVIRRLEIDQPRLRLARTSQGRYDIDDILARLAPPADAAPGEPPRFVVRDVRLNDGEVDFDDRPARRLHAVRAVHLVLPQLSSLDEHRAVPTEPRLRFALERTQVELSGRAWPFAAERGADLSLRLGELDLARWWAYWPESLPLQPQGGILTAELSLRYAQGSGKPMQIALLGHARLRGLSLRGRDGEPMLAWDQLSLQGIELRPLERKLTLGTLALDGAELDLRRNSSGVLDWAALGGSKTGSASAPPDADPAAAWQLLVQRTELGRARVRLRDAAVRPAAAFTLDALNASAGALRWPMQGEVPVQASAQLLAGARRVAQLKLQGQASDRRASIDIDAQAVELDAAAPYLKTLVRPSLKGRAQFNGRLDWATGDQPRLALALKRAQLDALALIEPGASPRQAALDVRTVVAEAADIDLVARRASIGRLRLTGPAVALRRDARGRLNVEQWAVSDGPARTPPAPAAPPWRAQLRELLVEGGRVTLADASTRSASPGMHLRDLRLAARGLAWPAAGARVHWNLSARLAAPHTRDDHAGSVDGRIAARGELSLEPLSLGGRLELERVALQTFEPYVADLLPLRLVRAELGWHGDVALRQGREGMSVDASGEMRLADVMLRTRASDGEGDEELLSWQSLMLKPLRLTLRPDLKPRVEIGELALDDFYSRLVITEQGHFNLRDTQGRKGTRLKPDAATPPARGELPLEVIIGSTRLSLGRVDFTDRYIKPNYSAALSELSGSMGRLASGTRDMAPLELRGRVAGTGLLEIRGALNPTVAPLALDISARATDLELAPLSPYAGKYAGFAIERGKLSLDVAYRIDADGRLEARNQLVLNQLTLGERVDSPRATKLPVRLALALLTDRNGVIDIELPISGSINDPQFSIFSLVLKMIGNLLLKAVTAPFSLLAGGSADQLSLIEFIPGSSRLAPSGASALQRVAKALAQRPALRMTVAGAAQLEREREAMQHEALQSRLMQERRRELARAGAPAAAPLPELGAEERTRLLRRLYAETALPNKPRNLLGLAKELPAAEMEAMLRAAIVITSDSVRELALQRGLVVRDALIAQELPSERLFLGAPVSSPEAPGHWAPHVQLTLSER